MKKQAVRRGVWYIGARRKRRIQAGVCFPVGGLAAPVLGALGGVVIKKQFGGTKRRSRRYV